MSDHFADQVAAVVKERQATYGSPDDNHAITAELLTTWLNGRFAPDPPIVITAEDVCAVNVLQKLSRLCHGTKDDSWLDIVGYADNVSQLSEHNRNGPG